MLRIMMTHMAQDLSFDKTILHLYKRIEFMYLFASNSISYLSSGVSRVSRQLTVVSILSVLKFFVPVIGKNKDKNNDLPISDFVLQAVLRHPC